MENTTMNENSTLPQAMTADAAPQAAAGSIEPAGGTGAHTVPPATPAGQPEADASAAGEGGLTVRFNHADRVLTREEAVSLAQKGLKYDSLLPLFDTVRAAALAAGLTVPQWVERHTGPDGAGADLSQGDHNARDAAAGAAPLEPTPAERLAEDFLELRRACPQVRTLDDVPDAVIAFAVQSGLPLLDAYLRAGLYEQQRVQAAEAARARAAEKSVGALAGGDTAGDGSAEINAMLAGLHRYA